MKIDRHVLALLLAVAFAWGWGIGAAMVSEQYTRPCVALEGGRG